MSDVVALEVGTIGENMRLRRAVFLPKLEGQFLNSYVHNSGESKSWTSFLLCKYIIFMENYAVSKYDLYYTGSNLKDLMLSVLHALYVQELLKIIEFQNLEIILISGAIKIILRM